MYLKEGSQKLMILNRGTIIEGEKGQVMYDYSACTYPVGLVPEKTYYFNEENVDKVIFSGFHDEDEDRFQELFQKWKSDKRVQIKKRSSTAKLNDFAECLIANKRTMRIPLKRSTT